MVIKSNPLDHRNKRKSSTFDSINVDQLFEQEVGTHGLWQFGIALLLLLSTTSITTFPVYANSASPRRCQMEAYVEQFIANHQLTFDQAAKLIGPVPGHGNNGTLTLKATEYGCWRYDRNWSIVDLDAIIQGSSNDSSSSSLQQCPYGWVSANDPNFYPLNAVDQFGTFCSKSWLVPTGTSLYMVGMLLGYIFGGWMGDRFGRRMSLVVSTFFETVFAFTTSFAVNYEMYVISRLLESIFNTARISISNVMAVDITVARYRSTFTALILFGQHCLQRILMAFLAFLIYDWRWLNLAIHSVNLLVLLYFWLLPESPRWLLSQGRTKEALVTLKRAHYWNSKLGKGKPNRTPRLDALLAKFEATSEEDLPIAFHAISSGIWNWTFVKSTLLAGSVAFGVVTSFFGLIFYTRNFRTRIYLVGLINAFMSLPAILISFLLYRVARSRKLPLIGITSLAALIMITTSAYTILAKPQGTDIVLTVGTNVAFIFVNAGLSMAFTYVAELFPADSRTQGLGYAFALARPGGIVCTYINELDSLLGHGWPVLIYGLVLALSTLVNFWLRDTSGGDLLDLTASSMSIVDGVVVGEKMESNASNPCWLVMVDPKDRLA